MEHEGHKHGDQAAKILTPSNDTIQNQTVETRQVGGNVNKHQHIYSFPIKVCP